MSERRPETGSGGVQVRRRRNTRGKGRKGGAERRGSRGRARETTDRVEGKELQPTLHKTSEASPEPRRILSAIKNTTVPQAGARPSTKKESGKTNNNDGGRSTVPSDHPPLLAAERALQVKNSRRHPINTSPRTGKARAPAPNRLLLESAGSGASRETALHTPAHSDVACVQTCAVLGLASSPATAANQLDRQHTRVSSHLSSLVTATDVALAASSAFNAASTQTSSRFFSECRVQLDQNTPSNRF